jgi:uncharacterized membrane protein YphA (DoxX/SURF4 family)
LFDVTGHWPAVSTPSRTQVVRHLLMRSTLGFILGWFGVQQILRPEEWVQFVPPVMDGAGLLPATNLVQVHGALLFTTSLALVTGFMLPMACLAAAGMLGGVIVVLLGSGGPHGGLVVRNLGLVALAIGVLLDPVRAWAFDPLDGRRPGGSRPE